MFVSLSALAVLTDAALVVPTDPGYMTCEQPGFVNNYDAYFDAKYSDHFLNGVSSVYDAGKKDRRFNWRYCRPTSSDKPFGVSNWWLKQTQHDKQWIRGCGGAAAINRIKSWHNNHFEDRIWAFQCYNLKRTKFTFYYTFNECSWTEYLNEFRAEFEYFCPNNGVIRGIESIHSNTEEDRKWKFECCQVKDTVYSFPSTECEEDTDYNNDWDGIHEYNGRSHYFLNGQESIYDVWTTHDRRFKWRYCKPKTATSAITGEQDLPETALDIEWRRSCNEINYGHAAIVSAYSEHDNEKEDREWKFKCGILDTSTYGLVNCGETGYLSNYQDPIDVNCPHNGVIRSIWSDHDDDWEDRLWKFECCGIAKADYSFHRKRGRWQQISRVLKNCDSFWGCDNSYPWYTVVVGIEQSAVETVSSSYTNSLSSSISAGYGITFYVGFVTVTGSISKTTSDLMSSALTITQTESRTYRCDKNYFYQWKVNSEVSINELPAEEVTVSSDDNYICTNIRSPRCPLGMCLDSDCQTCKDEYNQLINDDYAMKYDFKYGMSMRFVFGAVVVGLVLISYIAICAWILYGRKEDISK